MTASLQFSLDVEGGWPPVGSESLPFIERLEGFELMVPPLFVKDLAVGDVIRWGSILTEMYRHGSI
jgi:hypothetical protein